MQDHEGTVETETPDEEATDRELRSLNGLLERPITASGLKAWTSGVGIRETLIGNTVWGTIQWRRSIGHPVSAPFRDAFVIERVSWQKELVYENGALREVTILVPLPTPSKWDGPHDQEFYRVSFQAAMVRLPTRVQVSLAPGVSWTRPPGLLAGYRDVEPPVRVFDQRSGWLVLEPFEVVRKTWALRP